MRLDLKWVVGGTAVAGIGWTMFRLSQRSQLEDMLEGSPAVQRAIAAGHVTWMPAEKAAELVGPFNFTSPEAAMADILSQLPRSDSPVGLLPADVLDVVDLAQDKASTAARSAAAWLSSWLT